MFLNFHIFYCFCCFYGIAGEYANFKRFLKAHRIIQLIPKNKSNFKQIYKSIFSKDAQEIKDPEERLIKFLTDNNTYEKSVRPGIMKNGTKEPLTILVQIGPHRILDLVKLF